MDANRLLVWIVVVSSGLALARLAAAPRRPAGWVRVHLGILAATLGLAALWPGVAGWTGAALELLLVLAPARLQLALERALLARRFDRARRLARWLARLHPADGLPHTPEVVAALADVHDGRFGEAVARLRGQPAAARAIGRAALAQSFRQAADWEGALGCYSTEIDALRHNPDDALVVLRALGELGNSGAAARLFAALDTGAGPSRPGAERDAARLVVLAFAGRTGAVDSLLRDRFAGAPAELLQYWRAVAAEAAGDRAAALPAFEALARDGSAQVRAAAARRAAAPAPRADLLPEERAIVDGLERGLEQEGRYGLAGASAAERRPPLATIALIAANVALFLVAAASGGSRDLETLYRLGALVPGPVLAGEWWRIVAASFLHFGGLHLAMNMYGLWLLGPFLERRLGPALYLAAYFGSAVASNAGVLALAVLAGARATMLVGASGAVLGVVGATGAVLLGGWLVERAPLARRRLRSILLIVVLQAVFDLTTPEVSATAHVLGALAGFLLGLALDAVARLRRSGPAPGA